MLTLLPFSGLVAIQKCLDNVTLRRQVADVKKIIDLLTIEGPSYPIVRMWKGYEGPLCTYGACLASEIRMRQGGMDLGSAAWFAAKSKTFAWRGWPDWIGDEKIHSSHKSYLLRFNPEFYKAYQWKERYDIPYLYVDGATQSLRVLKSEKGKGLRVPEEWKYGKNE